MCRLLEVLIPNQNPPTRTTSSVTNQLDDVVVVAESCTQRRSGNANANITFVKASPGENTGARVIDNASCRGMEEWMMVK